MTRTEIDWHRAWRFVRLNGPGAYCTWHEGDTPRNVPLFHQALKCYEDRTLGPIISLFALARIRGKVVWYDRNGCLRIGDKR